MAASKRKSRTGGLLLLLALLALIFAYFRCGADFGLGGGELREDGDEEGAIGRIEPDDEGEAQPTGEAPSGDDAGPARCQLRLDADGLRLLGRGGDVDAELIGVTDAVVICREVGAAELVVTGSANFGTAEELREALRTAEVPFFEK